MATELLPLRQRRCRVTSLPPLLPLLGVLLLLDSAAPQFAPGGGVADARLPSGCTLEALPPGEASTHTESELGCFNDWSDSKRLLRHGIPGCCGGADSYCPATAPPGLDTALWSGKCTEATMTREACAAVSASSALRPSRLLSPSSCCADVPRPWSGGQSARALHARGRGDRQPVLLRLREEPGLPARDQAGAGDGLQHPVRGQGVRDVRRRLARGDPPDQLRVELGLVLPPHRVPLHARL